MLRALDLFRLIGRVANLLNGEFREQKIVAGGMHGAVGRRIFAVTLTLEPGEATHTVAQMRRKVTLCLHGVAFEGNRGFCATLLYVLVLLATT